MWPPAARAAGGGEGEGGADGAGDGKKGKKKRVKKEKIPLERCLRLFPHLADTGGFFVALLRKVAPLASRSDCWEGESGVGGIDLVGI